ncbi:MAG: hypothetical protein OXG97_13800 [Candidatus Poribacteria bacterium]|nr:hypothetical protein [Candidatus Poribacteria bacterium]
MIKQVWNDKLKFHLLRHWYGVTLDGYIVAVFESETEGEHFLKAVRFLNSNGIPHGLVNRRWMVKSAELETVLGIEEIDDYISITRAANLIAERKNA